MRRRSFIGAIASAALVRSVTPSLAQGDPLPSWNDGPNRQSIVDFVTRVTTPGSRDWVPVPERIATFDNDGTLWTEQPMYFQTIFAMDRVKAMVGAPSRVAHEGAVQGRCWPTTAPSSR